MEKRSSRIPELRQKTELSCMLGLFSILESCQGRPSRKLIANGRPPVNRHIIADCPRKIDQIASFDEECRKIQNEAALASVTFDASARNLIQEDLPIEKHKSNRNTVEMNSEHVDRLVKTHKRARKSSQKAYQPSSCCLNNAASSIHQLPSTQNHLEKSVLSGCFERSIRLGKYDQVDEISMQQVHMRAKALLDQMFLERKFISNARTSYEFNSFSEALEMLNSSKDLLPERNSLLARHIRELPSSQTAVKSAPDAKLSEYEGLHTSSSGKPGIPLASQNGKPNKQYQCQCSLNTSFTAQPLDKIVILKPLPQNAKYSQNSTCHCSSLQAHKGSSRRVLDARASSFSFRGMKKKLKHTFGGTRKGMERTSAILSHSQSTLEIEDECTCRGVDSRKSFNSFSNTKIKEKLHREQEPKSNQGSDNACLTNKVREKLDISSGGLSKKHEFDVILEAKRQLSARWKNVNAVETMTNIKSPRTLGRILSSPEHDFWPLSPRRDSQYSSGSAQMRFSPYNPSPRATGSSSQVPNGKKRACLSPLRPNTEVTSSDDCNKYDDTSQIMDTKTSSPIPRTDEEAHGMNVSMTDYTKSNGKKKIVEMNGILQPELHGPEVPSGINSMDVTNDTTELHKDDESVMNSVDSLSENEAFTSTVDDLPSTPLSIHRLDVADRIKYQEEHRSPVSVLEPFFLEDSNSPPSITLQTDRRQLKPLRLDFQECSSESFHPDPPTSANSCIEEQDPLSQYVHLVLQTSCLDWDQLSEISCLPEELLDESLFDEVEFLPPDCYFDPKLLFDHMNEVLQGIYQSHFCSPPWLAFTKPKIKSVPLAQLVLDEIMTEADFYLLPRTEKRTMDQLVSKDVAACRSWLDVRLDTEQIVIDVSEDVLEESILDMLLEFHT
ncbi:uncharacterized protein LOC105164082 isoform X1 [Sesamum indicum]|uniref:Uncharacterized protein LOC105164082 isoform X1 n=1 Tax=Sesamum indicum TaxID=4182 RepID=A0A6I9TJD6_SESIN|nr:uncharacterized protein LOC105164082 isoform X1 [Sesamum indicum]